MERLIRDGETVIPHLLCSNGHNTYPMKFWRCPECATAEMKARNREF